MLAVLAAVDSTVVAFAGVASVAASVDSAAGSAADLSALGVSDFDPALGFAALASVTASFSEGALRSQVCLSASDWVTAPAGAGCRHIGVGSEPGYAAAVMAGTTDAASILSDGKIPGPGDHEIVDARIPPHLNYRDEIRGAGHLVGDAAEF
jgi:hypothetical protein